MAEIPEAFVYDAIRTPRGRGKASGSLHEVKPISLVTGLIDELRARYPELDPATIDDVVLGVVSPIGDQGGDIAKTAAIAAGLPHTVAGVQLNRFCASGLEAVNVATQKVRSGMEEMVLAGGVEAAHGHAAQLDRGPDARGQVVGLLVQQPHHLRADGAAAEDRDPEGPAGRVPAACGAAHGAIPTSVANRSSSVSRRTTTRATPSRTATTGGRSAWL